MSNYRKTFVGIAGAVLVFLNQILAVIPTGEKSAVTIAIAVVTAFLTYLVPNTPGA